MVREMIATRMEGMPMAIATMISSLRAILESLAMGKERLSQGRQERWVRCGRWELCI